MRIVLAGGVGEHGRNCFLVESGALSYMVDCGIKAGSNDPNPRLTTEQIKRVQYLFLTHSHSDHTGAYPWLLKNGFTGTVVATQETFEQLPFPSEQSQPLDTFSDHQLDVVWGRSGHCAGGVWYYFTLECKALLFSGDYIEDGLVYACDPIRNIRADLAILDSAYDAELRTVGKMRTDCMASISDALSNGPVLLPVPKNGRGLELCLIAAQQFPGFKLFADEILLKKLKTLDRYDHWVRNEAINNLVQLRVERLPKTISEKGIYILCDPQLNTVSGIDAAKQIITARGKIILTGHVDDLGGAKHFMEQGLADFSRLAVHSSDVDRLRLEKRNLFNRVVPYHTAAYLIQDFNILL